MDRSELVSTVSGSFDLGVQDAQAKKGKDSSVNAVAQAAYDLGYDIRASVDTAVVSDLSLAKAIAIKAAESGWSDAETNMPKATEANAKWMPAGIPDVSHYADESFYAGIGRVYSAAYDAQKQSITVNKYLLWGGIAAGALALLGIGYLAGKPSQNPARGPKLLSARKNPASGFTVKLDNLDSSDEDPQVTANVSGPGAAKWAKDDQTIDGTRWESDGDDFAYAVLSDDPGLVGRLEAEGYDLNLDEYSPPDEHEEAEEEEEERGRTRYTSHGSYPYFYVTNDNKAHCYKCATKSDRPEVNYESTDLYCDECDERIESAYAEDEAKKNPARGGKLKTEQDTPAMEKRVRRAANIKFGREKKNEQRNTVFEHGQWWLTISPDPDDPSDLNTEAQYSVIDASPGLGSTGLDFERL